MKKIVVLLLLMGLSNGNILAQEKQREELLKQIAAFKVYIEYAQKGYSIAKKGLNAISDFKRGELDLHADYFNSLNLINPQIKNYNSPAYFDIVYRFAPAAHHLSFPVSLESVLQ